MGTVWLFGAAIGLKLAWLEVPADDHARLCDPLVTPDGEEEDVSPQDDLTQGLFSI